MGLGDIYNNVPQTFASGPAGQQSQAFESLPGLQDSALRATYQKQANADQAYNSPSRPATHHEAAIAKYVRGLMGHEDPNVPPEWIDRLKSEHGQMSTPVPMGQPTAPPSYMGGGGPNAGTTETEPAAFGGYGLSSTPQPATTTGVGPDANGAPTEGLSRPPMQGRPSMPSPRPAMSNDGPMTHEDTLEYLRMAPLFQAESARRKEANKPPPRDYLGEIALRATAKGTEDRKTEDQKVEHKKETITLSENFKNKRFNDVNAREWQRNIWHHEDVLRGIEERLELGKTTAQDKTDLMRYLGEIQAAAKERTSIPELADDKDAKDFGQSMEDRAKQDLIRMEARKSATPPTTSHVSAGVKTREPQGDAAKQALKWARDNPNDPRTPAILKKLGMAK